MSDLVTGDAVVLEVRLARLASRSLALAIDLVAQGAGLVALALALSLVAESVDEALAAAIGLTGAVAVIVGYPVVCETLTRGRTLGKLALGLRVVREDGGPIRMRHALVRALVGVIEVWVTSGSVALVASLASAKGKRLGDQVAGTVVVRDRAPAVAGQVAHMPPGLAGWASGLDLSRLPDDLALAARQFVSRAPELTPPIRQSMGVRLAEAVAASVAPPAPPGVPAEAYLAAVLAERRRRELDRLAGHG
ncbi:MAG: RDD family protein, partial [Actinomycetota bacterium]|nr:RDD family protein [Actinomycetota bacterium]